MPKLETERRRVFTGVLKTRKIRRKRPHDCDSSPLIYFGSACIYPIQRAQGEGCCCCAACALQTTAGGRVKSRAVPGTRKHFSAKKRCRTRHLNRNTVRVVHANASRGPIKDDTKPPPETDLSGDGANSFLAETDLQRYKPTHKACGFFFFFHVFFPTDRFLGTWIAQRMHLCRGSAAVYMHKKKQGCIRHLIREVV